MPVHGPLHFIWTVLDLHTAPSWCWPRPLWLQFPADLTSCSSAWLQLAYGRQEVIRSHATDCIPPDAIRSKCQVLDLAAFCAMPKPVGPNIFFCRHPLAVRAAGEALICRALFLAAWRRVHIALNAPFTASRRRPCYMRAGGPAGSIHATRESFLLLRHPGTLVNPRDGSHACAGLTLLLPAPCSTTLT